MYAVITDRTPNRCTILSLHESEGAAERRAEDADTGVNGMPAEVLPVRDDGEPCPGERAWHDGEECWGERAATEHLRRLDEERDAAEERACAVLDDREGL